MDTGNGWPERSRTLESRASACAPGPSTRRWNKCSKETARWRAPAQRASSWTRGWRAPWGRCRPNSKEKKSNSQENEVKGRGAYLNRLKGGGVKAQKDHKHEDEQDPPGQLHVLFWLVFAEVRYPREERFSFAAGLGEHQQEGPNQGKVSKQELNVPKNAVGNRLQNSNS